MLSDIDTLYKVLLGLMIGFVLILSAVLMDKQGEEKEKKDRKAGTKVVGFLFRMLALAVLLIFLYLCLLAETKLTA